MAARRDLIWFLARCAAGRPLDDEAIADLVALGLMETGRHRCALTALGRRVLAEGVHSPWFDQFR